MADTTSSSSLAVHRCRFVDFQPAAVTALAFPPFRSLARAARARKRRPDGLRGTNSGPSVVGRANGDIELCEWTGDTRSNNVEAPQAWVVHKTLPGPFPSKVDSLALTLRYPERAEPEDVPSCSDLRLFSAGGGSELLEWDLDHGTVRRTTSSQGGSIWSMAINPASTLLALGCEDGVIRLLSLELDSLQHTRRFDRVKCRLLSLAWGPPVPNTQKAKSQAQDGESSGSDAEEEDWTDEWLVTGGSDSSLRKWNVASGRVVERMGTDKIRGERTLVWTVGTLGDGTIISGDSMGMVKFWDSRTCTQIQSFQSHGADVLCLTISPEGTTIYTSGVDQKITQFTLVRPQSSSTGTSVTPRWVQSVSRRIHSHDVRALAIWPPYTPLPALHLPRFPPDVAPVLVSGGLDMSVAFTPAALPANTTLAKVRNPLATSAVATFEDAYHRRLAYAPLTGTVCVAREARLVVCAAERGVSVWRIREREAPANQDDVDMDAEGKLEEDGKGAGWEKVLEMELAVTTNIVACAVSPNGRWLAISDLYETKLFAIQHVDSSTLKPKRLRGFDAILAPHLPSTSKSTTLRTGASAFVFTPDSSRLVLATTGSAYVLVVDLLHEEKPAVLRRFEQHRLGAAARAVRSNGHTAGVHMDVDEGADADVDADASSDGAGDEAAGGVEDNDTEPTASTVSRMCVSADGQWLATTDDRCRTHIFNLDSIRYHAVVPTMPQPVHAMSFDPASPRTLVLVLANHSLHVYDVEARQFPTWARELNATLPARFTGLHDAVLGVAFAAGTMLLWGATWMCRVRLDAPAGYGGSRKRRREKAERKERERGEEAKGEENFKLVTHYRPLLLVDFLGAQELVVVERPLVDVLAALPPAYFRPKYGRA